MPVVVFDGVWKKFRRGEHHDSLRDLVPALITRAFRRPPDDELAGEQFWALHDVSFSVDRGEALGIIGPNGAGKSTTLKLLTKILKPSRGTCAVRGRVGALIEVAAGFHPDLTGRENIYLQGAVMGMGRREIRRRFDEIVDFAGVADFVDTPVKRYSSGMNARLGFAIAAHLDPEALIIDEVLSVGDMAFQQKCADRMAAFARQGVTIVFVSHNLQAVRTLCTKALFLQGGVVRAYGDTTTVLESYIERTNRFDNAAAAGSRLSIVTTALLGEDGGPLSRVPAGAPLRLRVTYRAAEPLNDLTFGFFVYRSTDHALVYDGNVHQREVGLAGIAAGDLITLDFSFRAHLVRGQYHVGVHAFHNPTNCFLARLVPAGVLTVDETRSFGGVADLALDVVRIPQPDAELVASC